jgi:hypothetical protein
MMMTPAGNLDDDLCLERCVWGLRLLARMAACALATIVFHDSRRGYLYRVFWSVFR